MRISDTGLTLATFIGFAIVITYLLFFLVINQNKSNKKLSRLSENKTFKTGEKEKREGKIDIFVNKLSDTLKEAEIKTPVNTFLAIIFLASVGTYFLGYFITGVWLVPIGLLPFPLYFVPDMLITSKKEKVQERFNNELILVLRRMSAITKNDSVLKALEDVKDYPVYSEKMRVMLNKIYLHFSYGDSIEEAFLKVANETPSKLFKLVAISIDVNKSLGSNLSANLHEIATQIQSEMLLGKEAKAIMSTTVATGRLMSLLPYGILMFLFMYNGNYFDTFFETLSNQFIFALILAVMSFGVFVVAKMSKPTQK